MRMIAVFEKNERIRHIGHLDIQRFVQRGLRRSGLPVAYSNGFSPHILVTFASALSTGACGKREIMDVTLSEPVTEAEFLEKMNRAMPPEMRLSEARIVDDRHPAMMATLKAASYDILIRNAEEAEEIMEAIPVLIKKDEIPAFRKTKTGTKEVDIKPMIYALNGKGQHLYCTLALTETQTCKPSMLMEALWRETPSGKKAKAEEEKAQAEEKAKEEQAQAREKSEDSEIKEEDRAAAATDSFGNRVRKEQAPVDRDGPVRVLVTRTMLLGEDKGGMLVPLERL